MPTAKEDSTDFQSSAGGRSLTLATLAPVCKTICYPKDMRNLYRSQLYAFDELTQMDTSTSRSTSDELWEVSLLTLGLVFVSLENLFGKDCICLALWVEDEILSVFAVSYQIACGEHHVLV